MAERQTNQLLGWAEGETNKQTNKQLSRGGGGGGEGARGRGGFLDEPREMAGPAKKGGKSTQTGAWPDCMGVVAKMDSSQVEVQHVGPSTD